MNEADSPTSTLQLPDGDILEPTSTIVLTSHSNYYVDIRVFKPSSSISPIEIPDPKAPLPISRLDWAFGGTAASTLHARRQSGSAASTGSGGNDKPKELTSIAPEGSKAENTGNNTPTDPQPTPHHKRKQSGSASNYRQTTWTHWVDSRHSKGVRTSVGAPKTPHTATFSEKPQDDWVDSATIYPTDKENESLEKGRMQNPDTALMADYEELWKDLPLQKLPHEPGLMSFVLQAENKVLGTRGLVMRIGSWCQGVIRSGADIGVERWRFGGVVMPGGAEVGLVDGPVSGVEDGIGGKNKWERLAKIGEMSLPCQVCWEKAWELKVGEQIVSGGLQWEVVEKVVWKE